MPLTYQLNVDEQATDKKEKQKKMLQILNSLHLFHAVNIVYLLPEGRNLEAKKEARGGNLQKFTYSHCISFTQSTYILIVGEVKYTMSQNSVKLLHSDLHSSSPLTS